MIYAIAVLCLVILLACVCIICKIQDITLEMNQLTSKMEYLLSQVLKNHDELRSKAAPKKPKRRKKEPIPTYTIDDQGRHA